LTDKTNEVISIRQSLRTASDATQGLPVVRRTQAGDVIRSFNNAVPTVLTFPPPSPAASLTNSMAPANSNAPTINATMPAADLTAPTTSLAPAPNQAGDPVTNSAAAAPTIPNPISTFDGQDPQSVRVVTTIVREVLRNLGHDSITVVKNGKRTSRNAKQIAIRAQKGLITAEEDLAWKVRGDPTTCTLVFNKV